MFFDAWVNAAADAVLDAVLADIRSGIVPCPHEQPDVVESALCARAEEVARKSPCLATWARRQGAFDIFTYAECGPGGRGGSWQTPITPFIGLAVRTDDPQPARGNGTAMSSAALCVLRPGGCHDASDLGFEASVRWDQYALRVLRDEVLRTVAHRSTAQTELLLTWDLVGGPHAMPCRVQTPVLEAQAGTGGARRRRR
jgi:hypothetical protein